jgi:hypothetical protein
MLLVVSAVTTSPVFITSAASAETIDATAQQAGPYSPVSHFTDNPRLVWTNTKYKRPAPPDAVDGCNLFNPYVYNKRTVTWVGPKAACDPNGRATGNGTATWTFGDNKVSSFVGLMGNGVPVNGKITFSNGSSWDGPFDNDGLPDGTGWYKVGGDTASRPFTYGTFFHGCFIIGGVLAHSITSMRPLADCGHGPAPAASDADRPTASSSKSGKAVSDADLGRK